MIIDFLSPFKSQKAVVVHFVELDFFGPFFLDFCLKQNSVWLFFSVAIAEVALLSGFDFQSSSHSHGSFQEKNRESC